MESRLRAPSLCAASCDSGYALSKSTRAAPPAPMIFYASTTTLAAAVQCNQRHCNCCTFGNQKAAMDAVIIAAAAGHAMGCAHSIRRIRRIRQRARAQAASSFAAMVRFGWRAFLAAGSILAFSFQTVASLLYMVTQNKYVTVLNTLLVSAYGKGSLIWSNSGTPARSPAAGNGVPRRRLTKGGHYR